MDTAAEDGSETIEAGERGDVLGYSCGADGAMFEWTGSHEPSRACWRGSWRSFSPTMPGRHAGLTGDVSSTE